MIASGEAQLEHLLTAEGSLKTIRKQELLKNNNSQH